MTRKPASRETLERLAEAVSVWSASFKPSEALVPGCGALTERAALALAAYRAETTPPLRTRAEVDAEIVTQCREYHDRVQRADGHAPHWDGMTKGWVDRMNRLCAEPIAPGPVQSFHERVAELIGMSDGDSGRYIYADEESVLSELRQLKQRANYFNPAEPTAPEGETP